MNRGSWTGKVIYFVYFCIKRLNDIMADQLKLMIIQQVANITFIASKIII